MTALKSLLVALCAATVVGLGGGVAAAAEVEDIEHDALFVGHVSSWHLLGGVGGGPSFGSVGNGGFMDAQLSVARIKYWHWMGAYGSAQYDFGPRDLTAMMGAEFGYAVVGIDGGLAMGVADGDLALGAQGRVLLTLGLASLYGRLIHWPDSNTQRVQVGLMFKLPLLAPWGFDPF